MARSAVVSSWAAAASPPKVAASAARDRCGSASSASGHRLNTAGSVTRSVSMTRCASTGPMPSCSRTSRNQASSIGGIGHHPGRGEEVLHVRGLGEPQSAVLHVRDAARGQLDFQQVAVVRGPDQHRLLLERHARLILGQHSRADLPCLGGLVVAADELRPLARAALGRQRQLKPGRLRPDLVGQQQDLGPGPVVAVQPDDRQVGEGGAERAQVLGVGAAEGIDGLRVVADAGQPVAAGPQQPHDVGLHGVDVLVLVNEHRVEQRAQRSAGGRVGQRGPPQQQQVIEVHQTVLALERHEVGEQAGQLLGERHAPRIRRPPRRRRDARRCSRSACRCPRTSRPAGPAAPVPVRPCSSRSVSMMSATSAVSMTLNSGGSANASACARMMRCATAWNVPPKIRSAA